MRFTLAALALAGAVANAQTPPGCMTSYSGSFEIETVNITATGMKRDLASRQSSALVITLQNGVLKDSQGRTGEIVANGQFQFDNPTQSGALYTSGFSVCSNGSLAVAGTTVFQQCLIDAGHYNLYLTNSAAQCTPIHIVVIPASGSSASGAASQLSDGQPQATPLPICQLSDGQPQATQCASAAVTQLSDGQPQATSAKAIATQLSDGQPQVTSALTSAKGVATQLTDGQIQVTTAKTTTSKAAVVSQLSDGQPQAPPATASFTTSRPAAAYSGAAVPAARGGEVLGLAAGVLAAALL